MGLEMGVISILQMFKACEWVRSPGGEDGRERGPYPQPGLPALGSRDPNSTKSRTLKFAIIPNDPSKYFNHPLP